MFGLHGESEVMEKYIGNGYEEEESMCVHKDSEEEGEDEKMEGRMDEFTAMSQMLSL